MARRILLLVGALVVFVVAVYLYVAHYVFAGPTLAAGNTAEKGGGATTNIHLEVVGAVGAALEYARPNDGHPDWVGYLPTTLIKVPANSTINVTIDQEDSATGLRNPFWARSQGTGNGTFHMTFFDDKGNAKSGDFSTINPDDAAHTFAIPDLGVFVPLAGVNPNAPPNAKNVITFTFQTHGPGIYRWQCFVPCGAGTLFGNGGPMSTYGYMGGELVVS